jgi:putative transposase
MYMKLVEYFAEHYDVFMMENINMRQLAGKSLRRMRLHNVALYLNKGFKGGGRLHP